MPGPKCFDCYDCGGITGDHYGFGPFFDQEIAQSQSSIPNFRKLFIPIGTPSGVSYVSERGRQLERCQLLAPDTERVANRRDGRMREVERHEVSAVAEDLAAK